MFGNWMRMTNDAVMLGFEMQRVIGLRLLKLSRGGRAAEVEALRMVTEKTIPGGRRQSHRLPHRSEDCLKVLSFGYLASKI
jgi:hypothetical protein